MAELEQGLEELKEVKQAFKDNFESENVSTSNVEFRNMPELIKGMEKKLLSQTKTINPSTNEQVVTADSGYKLTQVNVQAVKPSDYYKPEQSLSVSPKTTPQTLTPSGNNVYNRVDVSAVTSAIDSNIIPTNIRKGKTILGVVGNLEADKPDQQKTVNPTTSQQSVVADSGYELAKVTVNAVTSAIDNNIKSSNIKKGVAILGVIGSLEESVAPVVTLQEKTVNPTTNAQSIIADTGYTGLSKVNVEAVTSAIDENIKAENIKKDVTILGVTGTMEASAGGSPKFAELVEGSIKTVENEDLANVTMIRASAFKGLTNMTSAVIPSNVISIGDEAFVGCTNLQTLLMAEGVQTIGANAFNGISASVVDIPSSVISIGEGAFANNTAINSVTIPSGLAVLPASMFGGCTSLTEVIMEADTPPSVTDTTFPDNVTTIYVKYGAYNEYVANWTAYADKIVRLPAIPSTITVIVNNYLGDLISGANVTITGNEQTFTGTTDANGVFSQGGLQPATYTVSVADFDGFKTPNPSEVVVEENTQNNITITYLEKPAFSTVFGENSPDIISNISNQISANNMTSAEVESTYGWKLGDTISYQLSTGENIEMRIIGFNHDDKSDGSGKAGLTLEMTNCLGTTYQMNSSKYNSGGFPNMTLNKTTLPTIKSQMPIEWQNAIKMVDKKSGNGGGTYYSGVVTSSEDLFILAEIELTGSSTSSGGTDEGFVYEYWNGKNATSRIKTLNGTYITWWTRTCGSTTKIIKCVQSNTGGINSANEANAYNGVSFAFCI